MDRDYFSKYYTLERTHWWFLVRAGIITDIIRSKVNTDRQLNILNIGSATGRTSEILQEFGNVISVEYDKESVEFSRSILKTPVIHGSINDLPFPNEKFDLVCAFDVIEHVKEDKNAISEMYRVCKPSGSLFLTVPAFQSLWSAHDEINHHFRRYRKSNLLKLFSTNEGSILRATYFNTILFVPIFILRSVQVIFSSKNTIVEKSDFESIKSPFINKIFYLIFSLERWIIKQTSFPFGVSILLLWKKK